MSETVQIRERGVLTLPASLRKRHGIRTGDSFRLIDFDGILVLTPLSPMVPELAYEIERLRKEAGFTTEALIQGLREQRERYVAERYGDDPDAGSR
jgi:bifunctional DNA-binding transcriptional regulator/antitoxin component of YhaV-PrlF toxin-antitoxin module